MLIVCDRNMLVRQTGIFDAALHLKSADSTELHAGVWWKTKGYSAIIAGTRKAKDIKMYI